MSRMPQGAENPPLKDQDICEGSIALLIIQRRLDDGGDFMRCSHRGKAL